MAEAMEVRVPYPDHPDRCQANKKGSSEGHTGQCDFFKTPGTDYCSIHGGHASAVEAKSMNLYRIKKWQGRLSEFKAANGARTLDDELALMRIVLEETLNKCDDSMTLQLYSTKISELINDIKGLVVAADKLATKAGTLIGRSEAVVIAGRVVEIISRHLEPEILEKVAEEIVTAFITVDNEK